MTSARRSCFPKAVFANCPRLSILLSCTFLLVMGIAATPLHSQTYTDLHDFNCATDGCNSSYNGIMAQGRDGNLYGTLRAGGTFSRGTVFKITPAGAITTLYNFSGPDGSNPTSGLTLGTDGNFYGTTYAGGLNSVGTIFKITPAGTLTTLHSFTASDGYSPYAPPVLGKNGSYYGVNFGGTAYSITSSGTFKLLNPAIPGSSYAPLLLASDGNFYGTTVNGGNAGGYGTVFRMSATGTVKIVYNFDFTHGGYEYDSVVQGSDGFLYGPVPAGGSFASAHGLVFKLSTGGAITVLHEFDANSLTDGNNPWSGLVAATDGNFYGATYTGNPNGSTPYGALFKITKSGTYSVLHVFDGTHDGNQFATGMQHTNGILYGQTNLGGNGGVFYSLAEGIPPFVSLVGNPFGTAGTMVEILGDGLTGTTKVLFGTGSANFTVVSDTYMTAVVPASGVTGTVTVTTPSGTLKSAQTFKVLPVISSFTPTIGPVGTQVTITGTGLTGATKVTFGGVKATVFSVVSGTQVKATVPTGAKTGKVGITTAGGTATSPGTFTVN
jgi:uncharacterized repeat protein (TIGR03803 family)